MKKLIILLIASVLMVSCKNNSNSGTEVSASDPLAIAQKAYDDAPDKTTANALIDQLIKKISDDSGDKATLVKNSEAAYKIAKDNNITTKMRGFLFSLIKEDYGNSETSNRILELANQMSSIKRAGTANILYKSLMDNFANSPQAKEAEGKLDPAVTDIPKYIINIGEEIFKGEVDKFGINRNAALRYVDACEAYALVYNQAEDAPSHLFRAAEIAKSIRTYPKLLSLYDWIIEKYPNYEKTPTTYFLKGFVLENDLTNQEKAKEVYEEFIAKFPNHELRDDVDFLLEHLGKTDEEIREIIEAKQKEKEAQ